MLLPTSVLVTSLRFVYQPDIVSSHCDLCGKLKSRFDICGDFSCRSDAGNHCDMVVWGTDEDGGALTFCKWC